MSASHSNAPLQISIVARLEEFGARIGEVRPSDYDDMSSAVYELANVVFQLAGIEVSGPRSAVLNLALAVGVLRSQRLSGASAQIHLEAIQASLEEMFVGLEGRADQG